MVMFLNSGGDKFNKSEKLANYISELKEKKEESEMKVYNKILHPKKDLSVQLVQVTKTLFKQN